MREYESRVIKYTDQLESALASHNGAPVNASDFFNWFSFDVMGDLTFGQSFGGLEQQRTHWAITAIHDSNAALGLLGPIPWLIHLMTKLPNFMNPMYKLLLFSEQSVEKRKQMDLKEPDIMSHILTADRFFENPELEYQLLMGDARLLIIGGSDTTASALVYLFYHLATDSGLVEKLRAELEANGIRSDDSFTVQAVQNLPYLNALIDEDLRLHPPVPGLPIRDIPAEGLKVGDKVIPGGVQILTPQYSIHRCKTANRCERYLLICDSIKGIRQTGRVHTREMDDSNRLGPGQIRFLPLSDRNLLVHRATVGFARVTDGHGEARAWV
jgi:cytochrome P450 family 628